MFERMMAIERYRREQDIAELKRKAEKAVRRDVWTVEEVDYFNALATRTVSEIKWD